jgi:hypothetical protein
MEKKAKVFFWSKPGGGDKSSTRNMLLAHALIYWSMGVIRVFKVNLSGREGTFGM